MMSWKRGGGDLHAKDGDGDVGPGNERVGDGAGDGDGGEDDGDDPEEKGDAGDDDGPGHERRLQRLAADHLEVARGDEEVQEDVDGRDEGLGKGVSLLGMRMGTGMGMGMGWLTENMTKLWVTLPGALEGVRKSTADVLRPPTEAMSSQKRVKRRMMEKGRGWLIIELALPDIDDFVSRDSRLSDMASASASVLLRAIFCFFPSVSR